MYGCFATGVEAAGVYMYHLTQQALFLQRAPREDLSLALM
jgi:hypothetical protein